MHGKGVRPTLRPAQILALLPGHDTGRRGSCGGGSFTATAEAGAEIGPGGKRGLQIIEIPRQGLQYIRQCLRRRADRHSFARTRNRSAGETFSQSLDSSAQISIDCSGLNSLSLSVAQQITDLARTQRHVESRLRGFRKAVCLIDDHHLGTGQQPGKTILPERHIREQQMMIDHGKIAARSLAACGHDVTALDIGAAPAETVVCGGGHEGPHRGLFFDACQFTDIAAFSAQGPLLDAAQPGQQAPPGAIGKLQRTAQAVETQIIAAPFEQRHPGRPPQGTSEHRKIPVKKLILQRPRTGGDDHPASREQSRNEVGERLSRASACLDGKMLPARYCLGYAAGHLQLLRPRRETVEHGGQRAVTEKKTVNIAGRIEHHACEHP